MKALFCMGVGAFMMHDKTHAWLYRDDIGAFWGIKGYEE